MSEDNVVPFPGLTRIDSDPQRVLEAAIKAGLEGVVIAGFANDGSEYFAASFSDGRDTLWLLERCKIAMFQATVDE